ncbi:hypothetical protein GCM10011390_13910 [Aureimonas endophytica]|uniref:SpoVT-AbrB domain-containing protein n=1 Tax=Aureimonas endophytica TaxID=2027858 RepID=A0A916ZGJ9_9HYPH|nr:AbrB/MazE/SpoVT family DNA-binding domain-containing protein [Aureimonas endophytica]GGD96350.1 hypothetical protein GCM10011390_13910 [Aureimonas endophytica]
MADTAKLSATFEIAIPEAVRAAQNWTAGQELVFVPKGNGVLLVPVPAPSDLAGSMKGARTTDYRDREDRV